MSCNRVRRELLAQMAFGEEPWPGSVPHLDHLESCADCREEVGIDRDLVRQLRRALQDRVEGHAPSPTTWSLVRSRTVDQAAQPWAPRLVRWGGMVAAAAAAGVMMIAVATAPEARLLAEAHSPFVTSAARRAVPAVDETIGWPYSAILATSEATQTAGPLPGWPMQTQVSVESTRADSEPPITRRAL